MKTNIKTSKQPIYTHGGAEAVHINAELRLRRSVLSCMLFEGEFYEDGVQIAQRIADTIPLVDPAKVAAIAIEAREKMKLRHVPLFIVREMARHLEHKKLVATTLDTIIQRVDELAEFLAIYWKDKKQPLSAQVKTGLASAFLKFDEYALAKYDRDNDIKLRDVLFLCHARPSPGVAGYTRKARKSGAPAPADKGSVLFRKLITGDLATPDTWEVNLSAGKDKKETFERLIRERKLGGLATLRNLRNMVESGINEELIGQALASMKVDRVLPFRFIAAARAVPRLEDKIEPAMLRCLEGHTKLAGRTIILVDVSGSMYGTKISAKGDLDRIDAACALAILVREISDCQVYTFSSSLKLVPPRHGFALRDAITQSQSRGGTYLGHALEELYQKEKFDRLIVFTDEQSHDSVPAPRGRGYIVNVASNQNGVGYGEWVHVDGFSEAVIEYIQEYEKLED